MIHRIKKILVILAGLVGVFVVAGLSYQAIAEWSDLRRYPPPGRLVDVGGYRLHIDCTGQGSPTVILESGLQGPGLQWTLVQSAASKRTQVCSYDRAGLGWSDSGPLPRDSQQMVTELHTLLAKAGLQGPFVLVGHSMGGLNVRLYAHQYPQDVAGIILVGAGHEADKARMPPEYTKIEAYNLQTYRRLPRITRLGLTRLAGNLGLLSAYTGLLGRLPPDLQAEMTALTFYRARHWETAAQELAGMDATRAELASVGSLGDLPPIVISGKPDTGRLPAIFPVQQIIDTSRELQDELAVLSTRSEHIVCDTCGHYIPMENPELVVDAIWKMLDEQ
jgi:pimeloyl-ACP methyl ester carboxylesterase